jgi:hypothetical protein
MLRFLDNLVHYADPTLPAFSSLTSLYILILAFSLAIAVRSRQHAQEDNAL